ncbi:MAG: hypothetical protein PUA73_01705 [Bacilli bacterium]|nr:hypothetical protein [Bacilli bacterium]
MNNYDLEEAALVKLQIGLTLITILTIIISLYLSYDTLLGLEKKNKLFSENFSSDLLLINRYIGVFLAVCFLLINIYDKEVKVKYGKDLKEADIQIWSSVLGLVATLLVLYVSFSGDSLISEENPFI